MRTKMILLLAVLALGTFTAIAGPGTPISRSAEGRCDIIMKYSFLTGLT